MVDVVPRHCGGAADEYQGRRDDADDHGTSLVPGAVPEAVAGLGLIPTIEIGKLGVAAMGCHAWNLPMSRQPWPNLDDLFF